MIVDSNKKAQKLATWSLMIALFFNPFGFDIVQYWLISLTGSLWRANFAMYCIAALFFGSSILFRLIAKNMIKLKNILEEGAVTEKPFEDFAEKRHDGAEKIAKDAKEKGGLAMLTYNHFIVKLPYYDKANAGKFNVEEGIKEYNELVKQLADSAEKVNYGMTEFQKLVGKIEVLGELIIKSK